MKKIIVLFFLIFFSSFQLFSLEWKFETEEEKGEFEDVVGKYGYFLYGESNGKYTDKNIKIYLTYFDDSFDPTTSYYFYVASIHYGGEGQKAKSNEKSCTIRIEERNGEITTIPARCNIDSNGYYWSCSVILYYTEIKSLAKVFYRNQKVKLVIQVEGEEPYNYGEIDCNNFYNDPYVMKNHLIRKSLNLVPANYLKFESDAGFVISSKKEWSSSGEFEKGWNGEIYYTTDPLSYKWYIWNGDKIKSKKPKFKENYCLYLCGLNNTVITGDNISWNIECDKYDGKVSCTGDIRSILNHDIDAAIMKEKCFKKMFYRCRSLTRAPALPATTLAKSCYEYMFGGCTSLTQIPALPAATLADHCYTGMFWGCESLKLSLTRTDEYKNKYKLGSISGVRIYNMFYGTGGTFTDDTLKSGQTLWTSNEIVR